MVGINLIFGAVILVLAFQNCSKIQTTSIVKDDIARLSLAPAGSCEYEGRTLQTGESIVAYLNSTVAFGESCEGEKRHCTDGVMSGSYNFRNCTPGNPAACLFNGQTLDHDASVVGFLTSQVPFGQNCKQEARSCSNGALSGSYTFASCAVGAPAACLFNGRTIAHGATIPAAFQNSTVPFGQNCKQEPRTCNNGVLTGSYQAPSCTVGIAASCTFNSQSIAHGQSVPAFLNSAVTFGMKCSQQPRVCNNGALSGSYTFASCNVGAPASCLLNGQQIAHGQSARMFKTSSVTYGQSCQDETRVCSNGSMSGGFTFTSCGVAAPASCQFNGQNVAHGQTLQAFQSSSVEFGQTCNQETRACHNGVLSGSNTFASCAVGAPKSCLFNGQTLAHSQTIITYETAVAVDPKTCRQQVRTCSHGNLSGTYTQPTCSSYAQLVKNTKISNSGAIDILIVMDNSGSMGFEQKSMASRTAKFLEALRGLNYQIAVTTTDPLNQTYGDGNIVKLEGTTDYIVKSTMVENTAQTWLSNTLKRSELGSGTEQAIFATTRVVERALAGPTSTAGQFLRANAPFAALVISDEDESANTVKNTAANLISLINTSYQGNKPFSFHSIINKPNDEACRTAHGVSYGLNYAEFSRITGGVVGDVCATDYTAQVAAIAEGVRQTAKTISLTCMPAVDAYNWITVTKDGATYAAPRKVAGMNLVFDDLLPNGNYQVRYNCLKP